MKSLAEMLLANIDKYGIDNHPSLEMVQEDNCRVAAGYPSIFDSHFRLD